MSFRTMGGLLRILIYNVFPFGDTMENHTLPSSTIHHSANILECVAILFLSYALPLK